MCGTPLLVAIACHQKVSNVSAGNVQTQTTVMVKTLRLGLLQPFSAGGGIRGFKSCNFFSQANWVFEELTMSCAT